MRGPSTQTLYNLKLWFSGFLRPGYRGTNWKPKRMRLALVSAYGMRTVTNLSFWRLWALGISKIGFLIEKWFILMGRMFPDVENTICWKFVKLFSGVQPGVQLEVSCLSSQVSGLRARSQVSGVRSQVCIYVYYIWIYITYLALKTMIVQNCHIYI